MFSGAYCNESANTGPPRAAKLGIAKRQIRFDGYSQVSDDLPVDEIQGGNDNQYKEDIATLGDRNF